MHTIPCAPLEPPDHEASTLAGPPSAGREGKGLHPEGELALDEAVCMTRPGTWPALQWPGTSRGTAGKQKQVWGI